MVFARGSSAATYEERFLEGLRSRRLFELAEKYCSDRLRDPQVSETRREDLVIELSRTWAEHAIQAPPAAQALLWQKSQQVVNDFITHNPHAAKIFLVRLQGILAALAHGELAREDAEVSGKPQALDDARSTLRGTIEQLRKLNDEISTALKDPVPKRGADGQQLSAAELSSLQLHVRYQMARGLRAQALCYPEKSADRVNALTQALEILTVLVRQDLETSLAWSCRLDEITCLRLLDKHDAVEKKLTQLEKADPPATAIPRMRAERIRLALGRGQIDEALSEASRAGAHPDPTWADANYAQLEAYLAGWNRDQRHDEKQSSPWEQTALDQARAIEAAHGPFWMRKSERLLARSMPKTSGSESAEALMRAAQAYYRGGQLDQALSAYDRAAKLAREKRDANRAFEAAYAAATIEKEREHFREAIDRYRALAMADRTHAQAGAAHLLAVYSAAQWSQQQKPPQLDEYERLLREHVATWPDDVTAGQAWWWLGRVHEHRKAWQEAIKALRHVKREHDQYPAAIEALGRCYQALLSELRQNGNANVQLAKEAARSFEQILTSGGTSAQPWPPANRAAAIAAARIWLNEVPQGAARAEDILSSALRGVTDAPPEWIGTARSLLVPALAAQGRIAQAQDLVKQVPIGTADEAVAMVRTLAELMGSATAERKQQLAALELLAISVLSSRKNNLDSTALENLERLRISTLVEAGRRREAIESLEIAAKKSPRDGQLQEELASLWMATRDPADLKTALAKWREVITKSRPGSPRWFRAHYGLARTQLDLGNTQQTRSIVKLVESTHPDLGGPEMKSRFEQLLAECDRAPSNPAPAQK